MCHDEAHPRRRLDSKANAPSPPDRIRGRVFAVDFGVAPAASSVSTLVAGWLAGTIGPLPALYAMLGAPAATVALWSWWSGPIRRGLGTRRSAATDEVPPHATPEPPI